MLRAGERQHHLLLPMGELQQGTVATFGDNCTTQFPYEQDTSFACGQPVHLQSGHRNSAAWP